MKYAVRTVWKILAAGPGAIVSLRSGPRGEEERRRVTVARSTVLCFWTHHHSRAGLYHIRNHDDTLDTSDACHLSVCYFGQVRSVKLL